MSETKRGPPTRGPEPATESITGRLSVSELKLFERAAREAGYLRPARVDQPRVGAVFAWLRSLGIQEAARARNLALEAQLTTAIEEASRESVRLNVANSIPTEAASLPIPKFPGDAPPVSNAVVSRERERTKGALLK